MTSDCILTRLNVSQSAPSAEGADIRVAILDGGVADISAFNGRLERRLSDGEVDAGAPSQHATRCGSLIASADTKAPGLAPKAQLVSINISTGTAVDPTKLRQALQWLCEHPVDVISASFVIEDPGADILACTTALIRNGTCVIGAAANTRERQQYAWVRQVSNAVRVFSEAVPENATSQSLAHVIAAPGHNLKAIGCNGDIVEQWRGQSSGATALMAGIAARWRSDGIAPRDVLQRLRKHYGSSS